MMKTDEKLRENSAVRKPSSLRLLVGGGFLCHWVFSALAGAPDASQTQGDFERMAARLPYLEIESVLYDRQHHLFQVADPTLREAHFRVLGEVTNKAYPKEALLDLLNHPDPKVRTLAAAALFDREDPSVLPALAKLREDKATTYDSHPEIAPVNLTGPGPVVLTSGIGPPEKHQTVGSIAGRMVNLYLEKSGYREFANYWPARQGRAYCAGWFAVQLARASRGSSPASEDCIERIHAVRQRIEALPADERIWELLWLHGEGNGDVLIPEKELAAACKKAGFGQLLLMLQNQIPSCDPDLHRNLDGWPYQRMKLFVLNHAELLLRPEDGDALLAFERAERKRGVDINAWWAVAAAHLKPRDASQILHAAMNRFQGEYDTEGRTAICIALWQLCGKPETKFILDWFYQNRPESDFASPTRRSIFVEAVGRDPKGKEIISSLTKDQRLDHLDREQLAALVAVVDGWSASPIVSDEEYRKTEQAEREYQAKQESSKVRAEPLPYLGEWRERLRASVPKWKNAPLKKAEVE